MTKILFSIVVTCVALAFAKPASAGYFLDGDFSATRNFAGYYIDCSDSKAYCGFLGWSGGYGRWYFMAADGTNYWLTRADYDPSEDLRNGKSVYAELADEDFEEEPMSE